ncbi:lipoate protein ligase-like protein [Chlamydia pecorum W73]|uniref:lipoate--protein ligase family protein n=1 Tax=Chlamydia pecorum TaxID=85991 RepID=UPI0003AD8A1C|nr:lipoate--protein ligase family protein [Chlamydia pecorum]AGW38552.1 lipoate protein ligase-like protein [Chlamydia pecorum W73]
MRSLPKCILLDFQGLPIFKQLQIEEALLRVADQNFCIFNRAVSDSVVLGISRDPNQDTYLSRLQENNIPVIKRYSGGGTVFIDEDTLMVSWIMNSDKAFEDPQSILSWTYALYAPMFPNTFSIQENDYTLGEKKIGGNAQYIQKHRWVHHTTFLWDMNLEKLEYYLPLPKKQPKYRNQRSHKHFLTTLHPWFPDKEAFFTQLKNLIQPRFSWQELTDSDLENLLARPHRKSSMHLYT